MSRAKCRAASGFRPKLHSRAESLSLESLDMSRFVGRESLDIPKFGRKSLDMGRESLDIPKLGRESLDILKFGCESLDMGHKSLDTDFRDPCLDFGDQILVCPEFRDPCPDFATKFWYVQTFADNGATHAQTFQSQTLGYAIWV